MSRSSRLQSAQEPLRLARPDLGEAELAAVAEVLESGQLTMGPRVAEFERLVAEAVGTADPDFAKYETEIKPYLEPFDVLVGASRHGGDVDRASMLVTVK